MLVQEAIEILCGCLDGGDTPPGFEQARDVLRACEPIGHVADWPCRPLTILGFARGWCFYRPSPREDGRPDDGGWGAARVRYGVGGYYLPVAQAVLAPGAPSRWWRAQVYGAPLVLLLSEEDAERYGVPRPRRGRGEIDDETTRTLFGSAVKVL